MKLVEKRGEWKKKGGGRIGKKERRDFTVHGSTSFPKLLSLKG